MAKRIAERLLMGMVFLLWLALIAGQDASVVSTYERCVTNAMQGYCVPDYYCHPNKTINLGANIIKNEVRSLESKYEVKLWCCWLENEISQEPLKDLTETCSESRESKELDLESDSESECEPARSDKCSWCVALYRSGGDVASRQRSRSGMYCGGAMVSRRVVLTSTTCVRSVGREHVTARLPSSDDPSKVFTAVEMIQHPEYNSGSHANDFALMVLDEDVQSTYGDTNACLDFVNFPQDGCFVVGFDEKEEIDLTPVKISEGNCRNNVAGNETACSEMNDDAQMPCAGGAPLLCPTSTKTDADEQCTCWKVVTDAH